MNACAASQPQPQPQPHRAAVAAAIQVAAAVAAATTVREAAAAAVSTHTRPPARPASDSPLCWPSPQAYLRHPPGLQGAAQPGGGADHPRLRGRRPAGGRRALCRCWAQGGQPQTVGGGPVIGRLAGSGTSAKDRRPCLLPALPLLSCAQSPGCPPSGATTWPTRLQPPLRVFPSPLCAVPRLPARGRHHPGLPGERDPARPPGCAGQPAR